MSATSTGFGTGVDPRWLQVSRFANLFGPEVTKEINLVMDRDTKELSTRQNRDAPRKTGFMASQTKQISSGPNSFSSISDAYYSIFVDQGTFKMAPRPFFTDNMNSYYDRISQDVNNAFANTVRRLLAQ